MPLEKTDRSALGFLGLGPKYYNRGRLDVKARAVQTALDWMRRKLRKYKLEEFLSMCNSP